MPNQHLLLRAVFIDYVTAGDWAPWLIKHQIAYWPARIWPLCEHKSESVAFAQIASKAVPPTVPNLELLTLSKLTQSSQGFCTFVDKATVVLVGLHISGRFVNTRQS
jgi:hypothetical protein